MIMIFQRVTIVKIILPGLRRHRNAGQITDIFILDRKVLIQGVADLKTAGIALVMPGDMINRNQGFILRRIKPDPVDVERSERCRQNITVYYLVRIEFAGVCYNTFMHDCFRRRPRRFRRRFRIRIEPRNIGKQHPVNRNGEPLLQSPRKERKSRICHNGTAHDFSLVKSYF